MVMAATISIALVLPSLVVEGTRKFESNNLHARHFELIREPGRRKSR